MLEPLLEFARLCRRNGLPVSPAELLDLFRAVALVGVGDRELVRATLAATLLKRAGDEALFDELFQLFFWRRDLGASDAAAPLLEALRQAGFGEAEIEELLALLADEAARLSPLARASLGLRRTRLEALLRLAGVKLDLSKLQNPLQVGFFTQQLFEALDAGGAKKELAALFARLGERIGDDLAAKLAALAEAELQRLRGGLRRHLTDEVARQSRKWIEPPGDTDLRRRPFGALSEAELAALAREVERLAKKLKEQAALRPRLGRRGRLDASRTLRRALGSGGVPFRLVYKRRRIDRPRLVLLCDISDSVRHASRFMLQLAYTLQERFAKVRSFVFVSDLAECTELFRHHELGRAVELAHAGAVVSTFANSNYGRAFSRFAADYREAVDSKTTVIVIGDGRGNYNPPETAALLAIKERARRLLWLNSEPPALWSFGDSLMRLYAPLCDRVETVGNLEELARVIDSLTL